MPLFLSEMSILKLGKSGYFWLTRQRSTLILLSCRKKMKHRKDQVVESSFYYIINGEASYFNEICEQFQVVPSTFAGENVDDTELVYSGKNM